MLQLIQILRSRTFSFQKCRSGTTEKKGSRKKVVAPSKLLFVFVREIRNRRRISKPEDKCGTNWRKTKTATNFPIRSWAAADASVCEGESIVGQRPKKLLGTLYFCSPLPKNMAKILSTHSLPAVWLRWLNIVGFWLIYLEYVKQGLPIGKSVSKL